MTMNNGTREPLKNLTDISFIVVVLRRLPKAEKGISHQLLPDVYPSVS